MPIGTWHHVVVDCAAPDVLATFWTAVLGAEVAYRWKQYVMLAPTVPDGPALCFQQVPEARGAAKNRLHLDLAVADLDAAQAQVEALGGSLARAVVEDGIDLRVCVDPEGNEFCLVRPDA